jgi:hypothetical protein
MPGKGKKPIKPERLERFADNLKDQAADLRTLANRMKKRDIEAVPAMGEPMVVKAVKSITAFIQSCEREMLDHE